MPLDLEFTVPPADLAPFVTLFYRFHCSRDIDELERANIAQFRFRLSSGPARYDFADGSMQEASPFHIIGPTTGPTRTLAAGPVQVFGMGLHPAGWAALMGNDASLLVNRCTCAVALFGDEVAEAAIALRGAHDAESMAAAIAPWLRRRLANGPNGVLPFVRAVDAWLTSAATPSLDALLLATGLSRRQLERRCKALYGAPPTQLARKIRALRAAVAMAADGAHDAEGFYDQSHMIREVKHFTGLTPKRLREEPGALAALTIARRRALCGRVGPLVFDT